MTRSSSSLPGWDTSMRSGGTNRAASCGVKDGQMWRVASEPGTSTSCRKRPCRKKARVISSKGGKTAFQSLVVSKTNPYWKQSFPFPSTSNVESGSLEAEAGGETPGGKTDIKRQLLPKAEVTWGIPSFLVPEGVSPHDCLSHSVRPQWHGRRARACSEQS